MQTESHSWSMAKGQYTDKTVTKSESIIKVKIVKLVNTSESKIKARANKKTRATVN